MPLVVPVQGLCGGRVDAVYQDVACLRGRQHSVTQCVRGATSAQERLPGRQFLSSARACDAASLPSRPQAFAPSQHAAWRDHVYLRADLKQAVLDTLGRAGVRDPLLVGGHGQCLTEGRRPGASAASAASPAGPEGTRHPELQQIGQRVPQRPQHPAVPAVGSIFTIFGRRAKKFKFSAEPFSM